MDVRQMSYDADQLWDLIQANHIVKLPFPYMDDHHNAWDETIYQFLVRDTVRNDAYRGVIERHVKDKVVVEIGPGSRLFMTRLCVEARARKIYAIEANPEACERAQALADQLGLNDKITLISAQSTEVELPELADVCLSEIIGSIGNAEGATRFLKDAKRFLKPEAVMIPHGCQTWVSPVHHPTVDSTDSSLSELVEAYAPSIIQKFGTDFPFTRYKIYNFPEDHLIAPPQLFEDMRFNTIEMLEAYEVTLSFVTPKDTRFDGLLLWIHLQVDCDTVIDGFRRTNWSPVYVGLTPFDLQAGDVIHVRCCAQNEAGRWTPAYLFEATVERGQATVYHAVNEPNKTLTHHI